MRGMPCVLEAEKGYKVQNTLLWKTKKESVEPRSVLDHRSPSSSTSTSSFGVASGSADTSGVAAVSGNGGSGDGAGKEEWALEKCGLGLEERETLCVTPAVGLLTAQEMPFPFEIDGGGDPFLGFPYFSGSETFVASAGGFPQLGGNGNGSGGNNSAPVFLPALPVSLHQSMEEKPRLRGSNMLLEHQQHNPNPSLLLPLSNYVEPEQLLPLLPKRQNSMADPSCQFSSSVSFSDSGQDFELLLRGYQQQQIVGNFQAHTYQNLHGSPIKRKVAGDDMLAVTHNQQQYQEALLDELLKVVELLEAGNSTNACWILARLNQMLSPDGKPLVRSAFYFKEALCSVVAEDPNKPPSLLPNLEPNRSTAPVTHLDVVLKLSAYKDFSEISPIMQFTNLTAIQSILEELSGCHRIHIVDFDFGIGGQWSSFLQELSHRQCSSAASTVAPSLRITALISSSSQHPLELILARETLCHFASELKISFELNILSIDSFNPAVIESMSSGVDEAIAVNIPVSLLCTSSPLFLRHVKQLSPRIVVSVDSSCDRSDLSFPQHFLHALHSCTVLLESIDAAGANPAVVNKIERFLVQPRITSSVLGRHRGANKLVPWRTLFALSGFTPLPFSNFTETQADCLLKRVHIRGFHVEKKQCALFLYWKHDELASVSAWRC